MNTEQIISHLIKNKNFLISHLLDFQKVSSSNARGLVGEQLLHAWALDTGLTSELQVRNNRGHDVIIESIKFDAKQRTNKKGRGRKSAWKVDNLHTAKDGVELADRDAIVVFETLSDQSLSRVFLALGSDVVAGVTYENDRNAREEITQARFEPACKEIIWL